MRQRAEFIPFVERFFYTAEGKPLKLEDWQKEKIIKPVFYDLDKRGLRRVNLALAMMPKKNGKSTLAATVAAYGLLGDGEPDPEIYSAAGDKDQAKIIFNQVRKAFERSPVLSAEVDFYKDAIERKDGEGFYKVLSADAPTAHGFNPHFVIWDELWNQNSYDLWEALTHSPARKQPLHFIVSYAGYDQYEGALLWDLYQSGLQGKDPRMFMFYSNENLASWVGREYLDQQRRRLPDHIFRRLHLNEWTNGTGAFLSREDMEACIDLELAQRYSGKEGSYFVAVDLGLAKDRTVITVCHKDWKTEKVVLDHIKTFQGSSREKLKIETVEEYLLYLASCFDRIEKIICDPWQMQNSIQRLQQELPIEEFSFSPANITRLTQNLFSLFKDRKIAFFDYAPLTKELVTVKIVEKAYGFRIDHESGQHDDHVISLGMGALHCNLSPALGPTGEVSYEEGPNALSPSDMGVLYPSIGLGSWDK